MKKSRLVYAVILLLTAVRFSASAQDRFFDVSVGVGPMAGHTTYQIGGTVTSVEGTEEYWFPFSELVFPMDVAQVSVESDLRFGKSRRLGVSLGVTRNLTTDAGSMEDSDWTTESNPNQLDVYSESDSELEMLALNTEITYKFLKRRVISIGAGVGYLYQRLDYECSDFDQWYPSYPWLGHDYGWGVGITYEATYSIPYLLVEAELSFFKNRLQVAAGVGISPYMTVEDEDNHVLRSIVAKGEYDGVAGLASLDITLHLLKHWFAQVRLDGRSISAEGTQKNYIPVEWSHDTDAEITSSQVSFTMAMGADF